MTQILTPTGYVDAGTLQVGDIVSAFDGNSGIPITNVIQSVQYVDAAQWARWWLPMVESGEISAAPPFQFYKINGTWTLNSEQSIWRNGTNVCHVKHLIVGDTVYDDADHDVVITSIDGLTVDGWWRFDIDGDHSYIADGLTLHNASRFWVSGTGTWDLSTTTHWGSSSGTVDNSSAPGSSDTCTFDASSGGGTVTPSYGGTGTFQSITCGAFTGTIDWSTNNESVTLAASSGANFTPSGTGTRTIRLGNGTWTLQSLSGQPWFASVTTSLTFSANSSTIKFTGTSASQRTFNTGGLTYSTVIFDSNTGIGFCTISAACTLATLTINGPQYLQFPSGTTTLTNAPAWAGTSGSEIAVVSTTVGLAVTVSCASGTASMSWLAVRDLTFSGGATFNATSSFDLGHNSGITITAPSTGGGGISRARAFSGFS